MVSLIFFFPPKEFSLKACKSQVELPTSTIRWRNIKVHKSGSLSATSEGLSWQKAAWQRERGLNTATRGRR